MSPSKSFERVCFSEYRMRCWHVRLYLIMRNSPSSLTLMRGARQKQDGFEERKKKTTAVQTVLRCLVAFKTGFTVCFSRAIATCFPSGPHGGECVAPTPHCGGNIGSAAASDSQWALLWWRHDII